ncbi:MAG TPA: hypothetical protein VK137_14860 [Planctomycetaceae bacterium]|nr:hypothetical protein [Planctomycetaceae bacterium]
MNMAVASDYDTQLVRGIQTALRTARELGYHVESMDITASASQGICTIHFVPLATPGFIQCGGDLTVTINADTDELIRYERGQ